MMENKSQPAKLQHQKPAAQKRQPNERGTINVSGFVRIFDPKTKQTFVETRG